MGPLHDNISALRRLAAAGQPEGLERTLEAQAVALADRVRLLLHDATGRTGYSVTGRVVPDTARQPLAAIVRDAAADYPDPNMNTSPDHAAGASGPEPVGSSVAAEGDGVGLVLAGGPSART